MSIQSIRIKNYKSIEEVTIDLRNKKLIPLIGINNVGKTNILEALNAIKEPNKNNYRNSDQPNFRVIEDSYNRNRNNNISTDFSFEVNYLFTYKGERQSFLIGEKKEISSLLEQLVNKNIKICENIAKKYFQNKYLLQRDFDLFIEILKRVLSDPNRNNILQAENVFPFRQGISFSNNIDDLQKLFKNFLSSNYIFSEKEIINIVDELSEFIESFKELKKIVLNYDFSDKIFYISTALEVYDNFQIFTPIDLSKDLIEMKIYNNYLSALIYLNKDYEISLGKIYSLLNNKKQNDIKNVIEKVNENLKDKFSLNVLHQNDESYVIYPEFYINNNDKSFLNSQLILIRKDKEKEYRESISLISQGLRNKIILKLNLEYCKKYSDKEIILLLDEPDQGLHISAILELYDELKTITEKTKTKIIYTTHSPYLLGNIFETYSDILIVEKDKENKTIINPQSQINISELSDTCIGKMSSITGSEYLIINALNSGKFQYVTVEGQTDYSFYTWYNENYHKNKNLLFISINGNRKTKLIKILNALNLNYISLYDNDDKKFLDDVKDEKIKLDNRKIITYQDIFSGELSRNIQNLETLLGVNNKEKHNEHSKKDDIVERNSYYKALLEKYDIANRLKDLFQNLDKKFGELND